MAMMKGPVRLHDLITTSLFRVRFQGTVIEVSASGVRLQLPTGKTAWVPLEELELVAESMENAHD